MAWIREFVSTKVEGAEEGKCWTVAVGQRKSKSFAGGPFSAPALEGTGPTGLGLG